MSVRTGVDEYNQPISDINSGYIGEFKYFGFETVPPHCLACDGSEVSRETYSELFEVFGETYGAGDGETTFNLPDFRGAFLRCIGGNAAALGVEQAQGTALNGLRFALANVIEKNILSPAHDSSGTAMPNVNGGNNNLFFGASGNGTLFSTAFDDDGNPAPPNTWPVPEGYNVNWNDVSQVQQDPETRPVNYAVNICVVYE